MSFLRWVCLLTFWGLLSGQVEAKIKLVTSTTDIAWAAGIVGGDKVEVTPLLTGTEDPHFVDAIPKFIRTAASADLVCFVGLGLEIGWMPKVLEKSGKSQVQPGGSGYCELGRALSVIDKKSGPVDRSMGDVHPEGNPHFWLGPLALAEASAAIRDALVRVDPANRAAWEQGYSKLKTGLEALHKTNQARLAASPLVTQKRLITQYHAEFAYFFRDYGLQGFEPIEEKPGVAPSAGRIAKIATSAKTAGVAVALASEANPKDVLEKFRELSGVPLVIVPTSVRPDAVPADYPALQSLIIDRLLAVDGKGR